MHQFYYSEEGIDRGPFTEEEILSMNLPADTIILDSETGKRYRVSEYFKNPMNPISVDEAEEFLLREADQYGIEYTENNPSDEKTISDDYQQYIDTIYKYTADQMVSNELFVEDVFRNLIQQDVPIDLAKTVVNNVSEEIRKHDNDKANTKIGIGIASLLIGLLVTAASYSSAAEGGTYIIATGAIIYGLIDLFRGIGGLKSKQVIGDDNIERILKNSHPITIKRNYPSTLASVDNIYDVISKVERLLKKDEILKPLKICYSRDGGVMTFSVTENCISFHLNDDVVTDEVKEHLNNLLAMFNENTK